MFSLVVLASLIAVSVASPTYGYNTYGSGYGYDAGYGYGSGYGYGAGYGYQLPATVSHQSVVNVHSKPAVIAPLVSHVPITTAYHLPAATSHQSRVDYISKPYAYSAYAQPAVYAASKHYYGGAYEPYAATLLNGGHYGSEYYGHGLGYGYGNGLGYGYGNGYGYGQGHGYGYY